MIIPEQQVKNNICYRVRQRSPNVCSFEIIPVIMCDFPITSSDILYDTYDKASEAVSRYKSLYYDGFTHMPYADLDFLIKHKDDLLKIQSGIESLLKENKDFDGITFIDRGSEGFQIKAKNKAVKGYYYISSPNIEKDFSDIDSIVNHFVEMWNTYDNKEEVESFSRFVAAGNKYGWD